MKGHAAALLIVAMSMGALVWVFLIQAPLLSRRLGRDRLVPVMMRVVGPLVLLSAVASIVMVLAAEGQQQALAGGSNAVLTALAAWVMPRALRAGGQSMREDLDTDALKSAARFVVDGGGAASRRWHRALGLTMLGLVAAHAVWLVVPAEHAPRHAATPETRRNVEMLGALVDEALLEAPSAGAVIAPALQQAYERIFQQCTMTGDAHEALHLFLMPVGEAIAELSRAPDATSTRERLRTLRASLDAWPSHFE